MIKRLCLWIGGIACLLLLTALLASCEISTRPTETCDWLNMPTFELVSPARYSVIDNLRPTITWMIDPASTCVPAEYRIQVWSAMNYPPGASAGYFILAGTSTTEQFVWPSDAADLLPGHSYYVYINAYGLRDGEVFETGGIFGYFSTGPLCAESARLSAPNLRWPPDNWRVDATVGMDFEWGSSMTCWPDEDYFIEVSKYTDFRDPIIHDSGLPLEHMWLYPFMDIPWENCTRYYWRVRPDMAGTDSEPFSETRSFVIQPGDLFCPPDLGGPPIPVPVVRIPMARLTASANCRSGPTTEYQLLSVLPADGEYEIQGTNRAGDSWMVYDPSIAKACWVFGDLVEVVGDTGLVMVIDPEPPMLVLPTETPASVDCSQWSSDQPACIANPSCKWDPNLHPTSPCVNK
jgi:hypothetical protein